MSTALDRLKDLTAKLSGYEIARKENMQSLRHLYGVLEIGDKVAVFEELFEFKAMNLSGVTLTSEALGSIKVGKYIQIIGIRHDGETKNKNLSLGYFGRSEKVDEALKEQIVTFVLRWRFEKSFMTLEHYQGLIEALGTSDD